MAARTTRKRKDLVTCEALIQKLREGQNELKSSIKKVRRVGGVPNTKEERRETKQKRRLTSSVFERPLNKVDDLPRKRARLVQLSPDHLVCAVGSKVCMYSVHARLSTMYMYINFVPSEFWSCVSTSYKCKQSSH